MARPATHRRTVTFAGVQVQIEYEGARAGDIVRFAFPFATPEKLVELVRPAQATLRVEDDPRGILTVSGDGTPYYRGSAAPDAARVLIDRASESFAALSTEGLVFHAAAVAWKSRVVLLPGLTGAGKSTLTAWLTNKGFRYLSDELAFVPHAALTQGSPADLVVEALPRPLHLKKASRAALDRIGFATSGPDWLTSPVVGLFRPDRGHRRATTAKALAAIVFPKFFRNFAAQNRAAGAARLDLTSSARAGLLLMGCLLNARNLPGHGFAAVSEMVRRVPSYELQYGDFAQLEPLPQRLSSLCSNRRAHVIANRRHPWPTENETTARPLINRTQPDAV